MTLYNRGALTPAMVARWINFDANNQSWCYRESDDSMPARQAEGVAALWNKLALHGAALLADEVGTGKTFQALGVMALLWKMKPDARVLVMAPNRDICRHWSREYAAFLREHYREVDHLVRNVADGGPIHEPRLCWKLSDVQTAVEDKVGNFFITTIYSLSWLLPRGNDDGEDKLDQAGAAAARIHKAIMEATDGKGFDLVIVDEAHYFRNADGNSQRAHAAREFFGKQGDRIGQSFLLMTATPSHSSEENVVAILGYATDLTQDEQAGDAAGLMNKYAIRRLRRMKGLNTSHDKYSYRHEREIKAVLKDNPAAELFFALYQKLLVKEQERQSKKMKGGNKKFLYGYLEGFESFDADSNMQESEGGEDQRSSDFRGAPDTLILQKLAKMHGTLGGIPAHPKYDALVEACVPGNVMDPGVDLHAKKHLVFVRRIPSVREISKRINAAYDRQMAKYLLQTLRPLEVEGLLKRWEQKNWSRDFFNDSISPAIADEDDGLLHEVISQDEMNEPDEEGYQDDSVYSRIANLFVTKKDGKHKSTDCSNVSQRFRKSESIFSLFLEPASDYQNGSYHFYYKKVRGEKRRDDYGAAALACRLAGHDQVTRKTEGLSSNKQEFNKPMPTLWGLVYDILTPEDRNQINAWCDRDPGIAENFGNYLKAGFLFASPVMIELYCWFTEFYQKDNSQDGQERYLAFIDFVRPRIGGSFAYAYFRSALDSFETLCGKIIDHALADWKTDWNLLKGLQGPALYASGDVTDRQRLILGFNSPFYPNVLTATSVFQEGVNLHVQCQKVHHYGIAWTPGDNEQRVGRVDRLFGRVNKLLEKHGHAELAIHYPYLVNSFDEDQLGSFLRLKHSVEEKMDACRQATVSSEIDLKNTVDNWKCYLRSPANFEGIVQRSDPYPACFNDSQKPKTTYKPVTIDEMVDLREYVRGLLARSIDPSVDIILDVDGRDSQHGLISLIEATVSSKGVVRKQPILVEMRYLCNLSALSSQTVYLICLKSPLATRSALRSGDIDTQSVLMNSTELRKCPLVKPALEIANENSHFYLNVRVDLPLFILDEGARMLSEHELKMGIKQLRYAADAIEWDLFSGQQDLRKEDIPLVLRDSVVEACYSPDNLESISSNWITNMAYGGRVISNSIMFEKENLLRIVQLFNNGNAGKTCFENMLCMNHALPLLKATMADNKIVASISYPADHVQRREQQLLECWMKYFSCKVDKIETTVSR